jgi:serine protease Do
MPGSGFVVSDDGYIVTAKHVVDNSTKITVSFDKGAKFDAKLIGADPRTDIALLKIEGSQAFPFVRFSEKTPLVGDWILTVGSAFNAGDAVTAGTVTALDRDVGSGPYNYIEFDATINRGHSGGPTLNLDGEVVGITSSIPSSGKPGTAFAIPAKIATGVVTQLKFGGSVSRGWLGVKIQNVDEDTAASLGLGEAKGALVSEVTLPGPAADAGLKSGDAILSVNGQKVSDSRDLARQIAGFGPGSKVDVRILRGQKEQTISVKLGTFPSAAELAKAGPAAKTDPAAKDVPAVKEDPKTTELDMLGLTLAPGTGANKQGVLITDVDSASNAAQKGLKSGDVILEIGNVTVKTPDEVANAVKEVSKLGRAAVLMRVKSGDQVRFVPVQLKKS